MRYTILFALFALFGCSQPQQTQVSEPETTCNYNNFKTPGDYQSGGVQMIDLVEGYKVWTKRYGNSP